MKKEKHSYVLCTLDGFYRVPDTMVLLESKDYQLLIRYLEKAVETNPNAEIIVDPDDCGECYIELEEFMKYNISAKPIRAETYEDICQAYEKEHFGFNYVLDAVLDALYNTLETKLKPSEVKWFALRSDSVDWAVKEKEKNIKQTARLDTQTICQLADRIKNYCIDICKLASEDIVDIRSLHEEVNNVTQYAKELKTMMNN